MRVNLLMPIFGMLAGILTGFLIMFLIIMLNKLCKFRECKKCKYYIEHCKK